MALRARKAVIPAAGLGTRFLPATKAVPKELLPVVDIPALEYVVAEAAVQALADILIITARGKDAIAEHFTRSPELEAALADRPDLAARARRADSLARLHYVHQPIPRGLGHAVAMAEAFTAGEPFAVLLGDDLIDERDPLLSTMIDLQQERGGIVLGLVQVPGPDISKYGCAAAAPTEVDQVVSVSGLVEKPPHDQAPSDLAVIGRYVLPASIYDALRRTEPGAGGEIQLTDAMQMLIAEGLPAHGVVFAGRRYDTGDRLEYLKAVVRLASDRPDLGPPFVEWLTTFIQRRA
ncbi:MAG: UTP--glucose-1-phosphate uridylyltransferase [Frankiaceae bacterium]|jgi:UTP--glucose-1-phosphate uridylyltransferase|nr:UTP--glucose-1-phosphate uridylyltransferase [Frankiaceae bacterium]